MRLRTRKDAAAHPIDFTVTKFENFHARSSWDIKPFRGAGFPMQWQKGYTGIIVEPTDHSGGGFIGVFKVVYAPGL